MQYPDIEAASRHLDALERILQMPQPAGNEALGMLNLICGSMARAMPDVICQDKLLDLRFYAAELFCGAPSERWQRGPLCPAEFLRLQLVKTFNAIDARLRTIVAIRRASAESAVASTHTR